MQTSRRQATGNYLAAAVGGSGAAVLVYLMQAGVHEVAGGPAGLPIATLVLIAIGSFGGGVALGRARQWALTDGWRGAIAFGFLCAATPLAGYAAVGLTVDSLGTSALFLVGTPVAALAAGAGGFAVGRALIR